MRAWKKIQIRLFLVGQCVCVCAGAKSRCRCEQLRWDWRLGNFQYKKMERICNLHATNRAFVLFLQRNRTFARSVCVCVCTASASNIMCCWCSCFCITPLSSTPSEHLNCKTFPMLLLNYRNPRVNYLFLFRRRRWFFFSLLSFKTEMIKSVFRWSLHNCQWTEIQCENIMRNHHIFSLFPAASLSLRKKIRNWKSESHIKEWNDFCC